ncbi:uncharacterized protein LOC132884458 [Neoarius graeffei]|uniref:uncharacterized protein LOC132884458 n=1 Tax=Neoarius graeffei TaxID=443677 RepID=UPI00298CAB44|nr:uncharacterized protein LOC132884458 [Neoarius graeffei]
MTVKHSQRLSDPPLLPWAIVQEDGVILAGHCTCMAGLGEVCSHVGALIFAVDAAVQVRNSQTVTQVPAYWLLPSSLSKVEYSEIQNIDFQSHQSLKRKLDNTLSYRTPQTPSTDQGSQKLPEILQPTSEESAVFLEKLFATKDNAVLLSVMPSYSEHFVPSSLGETFPNILTELYNEEYAGASKEELIEHCMNKFETINVSESQCINVELEMKDQSCSKLWFRFRAGRITASRMKAVCSTNVENPSKSLIKAIYYPNSVSFATKATKWGCEHEKIALDAFCEVVNNSHENFKCEKSELMLNPKYPYGCNSRCCYIM